MYVYDIGYYTEEESEYVQLVHDHLITEACFEEMVLECTVLSAKIEFKKQLALQRSKEYIIEEIESALMGRAENNLAWYNECMDRATNFYMPDIQFDRLLKNTIRLMKRKHGFKLLEKQVSIKFYGWSNLLGETALGPSINTKLKGLLAQELKLPIKVSKRNPLSKEYFEQDKKLCESLGIPYEPMDFLL